MAKAFTLASWNVEHFKGKPARAERVIGFLNEQNPDVFALLEVEGKDVCSTLIAQMPGYQFHITEGPQVQEVLVGVKRGFTAFFTQKIIFKTGNTFLRPGALLMLTIDDEHYSVLFLHTKSGAEPIGLGIRDEQFQRAFSFKKTVLDKAAGGAGKAHFLFLGDLNTMGMDYPFKKDIDASIELEKLDLDAGKVKMRRLTKSHPHTWWNGPTSRYKPADLDHVVASTHLRFKRMKGADIDVRGWPQLGTPKEQGAWIKEYSDHGLLFLTVEKVKRQG